jgi:hypothetical protein
MNDLTPSYESETGQVIVNGPPAGPAGEAGLVPVAGVDLAFDLADGHLVRAVVDAAGVPAAALLSRLFGPHAPAVLRDAAWPSEAGPRPLCPEAGLCAALSSLARLDAARATSPAPGSSPWWAAEAATLAERAGLPVRALAEARRAVHVLGRGELAVPGEAARTAHVVADIVAATDPEAARRLRASIVVADSQPHQPGLPGLDVAAEVEGLEKDSVRLPGLHWVLDPGLTPAGLFRPGLSPHSDLLVRHDAGAGRVVVQVTLASGADCAMVGRCQARLVDPVVRRALARAGFDQAGSRVRAELQLPFPLDELGEAWIEVVEGDRPVRSAKAHRIRRALRWADAALRAERAPAGLAPRSTCQDWAALAALAWERCRREWEAAGDPGRAAAVLSPRVPLPGPACLAEALGA